MGCGRPLILYCSHFTLSRWLVTLVITISMGIPRITFLTSYALQILKRIHHAVQNTRTGR